MDAALAVGTLVATPYVYMYDLVAVAVGFLLRLALQQGLRTIEAIGLAGAAVLILIYPYVKTQAGLAAVLIILALIAPRAPGPSAWCGKP
jgi:arabinofuranan 3-O-arabinosyltransferase